MTNRVLPVVVVFVALLAAVAADEASIGQATATASSFLTEDVVLHIPNANHDPVEIAKRHGYIYKGKVANLDDYHLVTRAPHWTEMHPRFENASEIKWFEHQVARERVKRSVTPDPNYSPQDPFFHSQWHLNNPETHVDLNILPAWRKGYKGSGITVAIVDDGLEKSNLDLMPNFVAELSYDFNYNRADPTPLTTADAHGTQAAGMACAASNSHCGVGSAPLGQIAGVKILGKAIADNGEAEGLSFGCIDKNGKHVDIYSCSWGPPDDGMRMEAPGPLALRAMQKCIERGRGGKGTIYVWACGNGRGRGDNINYDGYANLRWTIPIGSMDSNKEVAYYSESGSALIAVAPGSGKSKKMTTTTLHNQCSSNFGGTSAASPVAAGVIALMLEANPNLTWRDVQHIIIRSSRTSIGGPYVQNGAGLRFRHRFGFGLMDASAAVTMAESWRNVPPAVSFNSGSLSGGTVKAGGGNAKFEYQASPSSQDMKLEHVEIRISANTPGGRGALTFTLISPSGMESRLQEKHSDGERRIDWTYLTVASWGEQPEGKWTLVAVNTATRGDATINSWQINFWGFNGPHPTNVINNN